MVIAISDCCSCIVSLLGVRPSIAKFLPSISPPHNEIPQPVQALLFSFSCRACVSASLITCASPSAASVPGAWWWRLGGVALGARRWCPVCVRAVLCVGVCCVVTVCATRGTKRKLLEGQKKPKRGVGGRENPKNPSKNPQKPSEPPVTRLLAKRSMMRGQRREQAPPPTLPELRRDRDRRPGRAGEHPRC